MADKLTPFPEHSIPPDDGHGTAGWMGVTMVGLVAGRVVGTVVLG